MLPPTKLVPCTVMEDTTDTSEVLHEIVENYNRKERAKSEDIRYSLCLYTCVFAFSTAVVFAIVLGMQKVIA
jgi:hypothetical protein